MPYRVVVLRAARDQLRGAPPILQGYVDGILAVVASIPLPGPADAVGAGLAGMWVRSPGGRSGGSTRPQPSGRHRQGPRRAGYDGGQRPGRWRDGAGQRPGNGAVHVVGGDRLAEGGTEAGGAIRALAAGRDALWVGAPAGLFRVDFAGLP